MLLKKFCMCSIIMLLISNQRGVSSLRATSSSQLKTEVAALTRYRHPHILPLMGYCETPPCLVYPLMERSSLYRNLHEYRTLKVSLADFMLYMYSTNSDFVLAQVYVCVCVCVCALNVEVGAGPNLRTETVNLVRCLFWIGVLA